MGIFYGFLALFMILLIFLVTKTSTIKHKRVWYWFLAGFLTYFLVEFICIEFFGIDWTQIFFRK